eukprot:801410_1
MTHKSTLKVEYEKIADDPLAITDATANKIVFGYIRRIEQTLPTDSSCFNIPSSIVHIILHYYHENHPTHRISLKCVIVGDTTVGKSSIAVRGCYNKFDPSTAPTIGAEFLMKTLHYKQFEIKLQIWDTAGQERFRALVPLYYRNAAVIFIVYDITDCQSFVNAQKWKDEVSQMEDAQNALFILVGNKLDLQSNRQISQVFVKEFIEQNPYFMSFEISAKTGENVNLMFDKIAQAIPKKFPPE